MTMTLKTPMILAALGALTLSACVDPNAYPEDPNARTKSGAIIGGMLGAMAGVAVSGDGDELKGAILGGAVGAATGAAIGSDLDRQAAELRGSLNSNISVTNMGGYLVVNMPQDLLFATDSAALSGNLVGDLRAVANSLIRYPNSTIEVVGHTDNVGEAALTKTCRSAAPLPWPMSCAPRACRPGVSPPSGAAKMPPSPPTKPKAAAQ
jgi:hypothetical protein